MLSGGIRDLRGRSGCHAFRRPSLEEMQGALGAVLDSILVYQSAVPLPIIRFLPGSGGRLGALEKGFAEGCLRFVSRVLSMQAIQKHLLLRPSSLALIEMVGVVKPWISAWRSLFIP